MPTETTRTVSDEEPRAAISTFTQLLSDDLTDSEFLDIKIMWVYLLVSDRKRCVLCVLIASGGWVAKGSSVRAARSRSTSDATSSTSISVGLRW